MSAPLTIDQLALTLPANLKKAASQELADLLNNITTDPFIAEQVRNNFISYTGVLKDGKYRTEDYIHAVAYVSYKLMGDSNKEAWCKTFPSRHAALAQRGASEKEISAHVAAYNKGQLVNKILEQSLVPCWVLNADAYQKAINTQVELMTSASSEKVRSDAANSILTHLKKPEMKAEIEIDLKDSSGMNELKNLLGDVARNQLDLLKDGASIKSVTDARIIDHESSPDSADQTDTR